MTGRRTRSLGVLGWLGIGMLIGLFAVAIAGDSISGYAYDVQDADRALEGPSRDHWMGTDALGRDLASRLAEGARVSLIVAVASTAIALLIGLVYADLPVPGQDEGQVGECGMQALGHLKTMNSGQRHDICRIMSCKPICAIGDRRHGCLTECVRFGGSDGQTAIHGGCEDRTLNQVSII